MKNKGIMPLFMSFVMVSQPITVLAEELNSATTPNGKFVLDMDLSMNINNKEFSVELKNDTNTVSGTASIEENKIQFEKEVPAGTYTLTIKSENYATYTKQIKIDSSYATTLSLDNNRMNYNPSITENQKGIMAFGDINNDGNIDDKDSDLLINEIESGNNNAKYDFNNDGSVNVTDLSYIAVNYGGNVDTKTVSTILPEAINATISASDNTNVIGGNIEDITSSSNTPVTLSPANSDTISEENPVKVDIEVKSENIVSDGLVIEAPKNSENLITGGTIIVEDAEGNKYEAVITSSSARLLRNGGATATIEADGSIVVNIGRQVAIKKVTINVTASSSTSLVDIAKVEFVNGMENRIPAPNLNIPTITELTPLGDDSFKVTWTKEPNVSSYEVLINGHTFKTDDNTITITKVGEDVTTGVPYNVQVRSINGDWKSQYSDTKTITLEPTSVPAKPDSVTAKGEIQSISVSWKKMEHATSYNVYYKLESESEYTVIKNITSTSYKIYNLTPGGKYNIYVTSVNKIGESSPSDINKATVLNATATIMPKYKLINTGDEVGVLTDNIKSVTNSTDKLVTVYGGENAVVDNDPSTYTFVDHYDGGAYYASPKGSTIELTQKYKFDTIRFAPHVNHTWYDGVKFRYKNENGSLVEQKVEYMSKKIDKNGNIYYDVKLQEPVTTDTFQLNIGIWYPDQKVAISEIKVYEYDSVEDDVEALFTDDMHLELNPNVNEDTLKALEDRLNTPDEVSGEYHPYKDSIQLDIDAARKLLNQQGLGDVIKVNTSITSKADGHTTFALPLSDLQPLGISATEGETITLYVGKSGAADGTATNLKVYATQVHGESDKWVTEVATLKTGKNDITITSPSTTANERGGALYIAYTGNKNAEEYSIRIGNGNSIPVLDITKGKTREDKLTLVKTYVEKLEKHVNSLEEKHNDLHEEHKYDPKSCSLNVTDIVMDTVMYSFPATQVYSALKGSSIDEKAEQLLTSMEAMEQEVDLFYQHKGFNENSTDINRYPTQKLNIRYSTMFDGAFMYAGGKHIGIEYDSVTGLFTTTPVVSDANGKYISGGYSGWGIAHEIGHVINSSKYVNVEVTNNYFSMLSQSDDTNSTARIPYNEVYKHVTSGTTGKANNVFTQLGMYWQLHMFYDNYYNYKTFDTYEEQFKNLFFARVDSYVRDASKAPNGLSLNSDADNNFMRLACAAANKNLLPFFEAWGLVPNEGTKTYAEKFEKETAKIQYLDDNSRNYRLSGKEGMSAGTSVTSSIDYTENSKQVTINLSNSNKNDDAMLGYEIIRNGEVVAFVTADNSSYTDAIKTENNRVYTYEVIGYDRLLNATEVSKAGTVKVSHDGSIGKDGWTVETNMVSDDDEHIHAGDDSGHCEDTTISAIKNVINDNYSDTYTGTSKGNAEIILNLGSEEQITALKYTSKTPSTDGYTVYVSTDKKDWTPVKSGTLSGKESETIYFNKADDPCMYIYDASYVKLVINNSTVSLSELDILGPTGDNVELLQSGIGVLSEDFKYGIGEGDIISQGSTIITGTYKGNPAYNAVLLKDQNGNIINGYFIILAEVPERGDIGEVSSGTWIYVVDDISSLESVKAELYRVDDAETLEGQRLVSDTLYTEIPKDLPPIKIESTVKPEDVVNAPVDDELLENTENAETDITESETEDALTPDVSEDKTDEVIIPDASENETEDATNSNTSEDETVESTTPDVSEDESLDNVVDIIPAPDTKTEVTEAVEDTPVIEESDLIFEGNADTITLSSNVTISSESKNTATIKLNNSSNYSFLGVQTQIKISDASKITNVSMNWSEKASNATIKKCIFNKEKGTISIYVVSNSSLSDSEDFDFGTLTIKSSSSKTVDLTVNTDKTVIVSKTFEQHNGDDTGSSISVELKGSSGSGSSSSSSSSSSNTDTKPEEDKNEEIKDEEVKDEEVKDENTNTNSSSASETFTDISTSSWYYDAVNKAYNNKWFSGLTENSFGPDNNMTRAMLVTVLGRFDNTVINTTSNEFTDIPSDMYYAPYVSWAKESNIVNGMTETEFAPNSDITREQLAVMIYNYLKYKNVDMSSAINTTEFTDNAEISSWANKAVNTVKALGIVNGRPDGSFNPKGTATRAEIATILSNIDNMNIIK